MPPLIPRQQQIPQRIRDRSEARSLQPPRSRIGQRCRFGSPQAAAAQLELAGAIRPGLR